MNDRTGQQLGSYRLTRLLGRGGFGDVYLGEHIHLSTSAAIKILQEQMDPREFQNFVQEGRAIAILKHPNILNVLDFGIQDQTLFLVMEYAPNGTLRQRHPRGSVLSVATILPYVTQISAALQYAHGQGLVHRDVKPANMLIAADGRVLLSDFGIAITAHNTASLSSQSLAGTPLYMAPEQMQGRTVRASDQYALGVVVYEWLSGHPPFSGSPTEILVRHMQSPPPSLREKVPTLSKAIEEVVMKALAKDPKDRFPTIQVFAHALEQASASNIPLGSQFTFPQENQEESLESFWLPHEQTKAFSDSALLTGERKDFFVSYNKVDREWAIWIAVCLQNAGYSVLLPPVDFCDSRH